MADVEMQDSQPGPPMDGQDEEEDPLMLGEKFIPGLEKIQDETSELTPAQQEEQAKIITKIEKEYGEQKDVQHNKTILRQRLQFVHLHGATGGERSHEALLARKAREMAENGLTICVLNINFLKRLATRSLFSYIKEHLLKDKPEIASRIRLKIQEEEADEEDREELADYFGDLSEDYPLFTITDESCQEPERLDPVMPELTSENSRFHLWSSSIYAHGKPESARRYRLAATLDLPATIKLVMEMIDIDDDDVDIADPQNAPLRRIEWLDMPKGPVMVKNYLEKMPTKMISHKKHKEKDVWQCEECGLHLAMYIRDELLLGKPNGLAPKDLFIVASFHRFESMVEVSTLLATLLDELDEVDMTCKVVFSRRTVKMQDVLKTTEEVILSDSVSVRGVDKPVVIIVPTEDPLNPMDYVPPSSPTPEQKEEMEKAAEAAEAEAKRQQQAETQQRAQPPVDPNYDKPTPQRPDDEIVLYVRKRRKNEPPDNEDYSEEYKEKPLSDEFWDTDVSDEDYDDDPTPYRRRRPKLTTSAHHSLVRRGVNSLSRSDKDMLLDLFTDAPKHAVIFHYAEDSYQLDSEERRQWDQWEREDRMRRADEARARDAARAQEQARARQAQSPNDRPPVN